jgi:hypothetical protein
LIWEYLKSGLTPKQVIDVMQGVDPKFRLTEPTLYEFKKLMEKEEQVKEDYSLGGTIDPVSAIKNDGLLLDVVINKGLTMLQKNQLPLSLPMVLKAMDMKKGLLGVEYRGQTVWGLLDYQKQFDQLVNVLSKRCPTAIFNQILDDLKAMGWATTDMPHANATIGDDFASLESTVEAREAWGVAAEETPDEEDQDE